MPKRQLLHDCTEILGGLRLTLISLSKPSMDIIRKVQCFFTTLENVLQRLQITHNHCTYLDCDTAFVEKVISPHFKVQLPIIITKTGKSKNVCLMKTSSGK